jgi:hypothetical protein
MGLVVLGPSLPRSAQGSRRSELKTLLKSTRENAEKRTLSNQCFSGRKPEVFRSLSCCIDRLSRHHAI